jgi:hypothetical protein
VRGEIRGWLRLARGLLELADPRKKKPARAAPAQLVQTPPPPIYALLDGRECDGQAFTRLCIHLQNLLGPLPAGRLCGVLGAEIIPAWIGVYIRRDQTVHYLRREVEPKHFKMIMAWWEATGLAEEDPYAR